MLKKVVRNEKGLTAISFGLGLAMYVCAGGERFEVAVQPTENGVLVDDNIRTPISVVPSKNELCKVDSSHVTISVKEQIMVQQGYDEMISDATEAESIRQAEIEAESIRQAEIEAESKRQVSLEKSNTNTEVFKVTGYCSCKKCCGRYSPEVTGKSSKTASGTSPCEGRTVAVDPNLIPMGSTVTIDGKEYIAEDTGSAVKGKVVDIYFNSHSEVKSWGARQLEVTYTPVK